MMNNVQFVACKEGDLKELCDLSARCFREAYEPVEDPVQFQAYIDEAYNTDIIFSELQNEESDFFFLKKGNEVTGYLKVNIGSAQTEEMGDEYLEVQRIYLLRKFYRQGLGSYLIDKSIEMAKERGKSKIWLGVWEGNPRALSFYKKMGFVKIGEHKFYLGNMEEVDFVMEMGVGVRSEE